MTSGHEKTLAEADNLYRARANLQQVYESITLLSAAAFRDCYGAQWRLARSHFFVGQESQIRRDAHAAHMRGVKAAEHALEIEPDAVEAHFWLGVNCALLAALQSVPLAIFNALKARRALLRAVQREPSFHAAGPLRVLATLESRLPAVLCCGRTRARQHFEAALSLCPESTVTRIYYAEFLSQQNERAAARLQLHAVVTCADNIDWQFEIDRDRAAAHRLLDQ